MAISRTRCGTGATRWEKRSVVADTCSVWWCMVIDVVGMVVPAPAPGPLRWSKGSRRDEMEGQLDCIVFDEQTINIRIASRAVFGRFATLCPAADGDGGASDRLLRTDYALGRAPLRRVGQGVLAGQKRNQSPSQRTDFVPSFFLQQRDRRHPVPGHGADDRLLQKTG